MCSLERLTGTEGRWGRGWGGGWGQTQIHVLLVLLKPRLWLLLQLLMCFKKVGSFVTLAEEIEGEHVVPGVVSLKGHHMHTQTQASTEDCFMVMLAIAFPLFPSIHYKRKSTKYLLHCPSTPHPSTMQGQNHSDLDFYIYVYMYTTVCL